jgi:hypothetical protein
MAVQINKESLIKGFKAAGQLVRGQLDYVFLGLLGATTLAVAVFYGTEVTTPAPPVVEPKPVELAPEITADEGDPKSKAYFDVFQMLEAPKPFEQTEFQQLIDFNMFDARAARDAEELHDQAKKRLSDAEAEFEKGNYEEASRLATEALDRAPTMQAATRLIERIKAMTEPEAMEPSAEGGEEAEGDAAEGEAGADGANAEADGADAEAGELEAEENPES